MHANEKTRQKGPVSESLIYIQIGEIILVCQSSLNGHHICPKSPRKNVKGMTYNHLNLGPLGRMLFTSREIQCAN